METVKKRIEYEREARDCTEKKKDESYDRKR